MQNHIQDPDVNISQTIGGRTLFLFHESKGGKRMIQQRVSIDKAKENSGPGSWSSTYAVSPGPTPRRTCAWLMLY